MRKHLNISVGDKFGRLTVISLHRKRRLIATCQCDCGGSTTIDACSVTSGNTSSCGCLRLDRLRKALKTHGESAGTPEYKSWQQMLGRCYTPTNAKYKNYGARGIAVCGEWRDCFESFLADMGRKPSNKHTLDRIDNDGNYEPSNCRWATNREQSRNRRSNLLIEYKGRTQTLAGWIEELRLNDSMVRARIMRGIPPETAFTNKRLVSAYTGERIKAIRRGGRQ
jgi:hypothetical protein